MSEYHTPVLLNESVSALNIHNDGIYADATLGGGGHTREILSRLGPQGKLIVFDRDTDALANAPKDDRIICAHNNFKFINNYVRYYHFDGLDGILADLGVSSHQFDTPERGFSFRFDADIDMRMNTLAKKSASEILNTYAEDELARIFKIYGELDRSKKVASLICSARRNRPIESTFELNEVVKSILPPAGEHKVLAKIYQALRIEVNGEMESLERFLESAYRALKPGGILSIITYHSLEDRMVKNFFRCGNVEGKEDKDLFGRRSTPFELITRKPILPTEEEISNNTRARSAKLRVAKKL